MCRSGPTSVDRNVEISYRSVGSVTVLDLTGRLSVGADEREVAPLRAVIRDLIAGGCRDVVVNLSGLMYIDARGLGELATAAKMLRDARGRLTLSAATPRVARLLAVTRLNTVLECCEAEVVTA